MQIRAIVVFASAIPIALTLSAVDGPIPLGDAIGGVTNSSPGGSSIGQKISNNHKNITVVAFDGYAMYSNGIFNGRINSVSKNYLSSDGLGEMVIFKGGVEIQRGLFQSPWEHYFRSLRN